MQTARNIAIILLLALAVDQVPGGGTAAETVLTAMTMAFLTVIAWTVFRVYREQQLTIAGLSDGYRVLLFGAVALIALMIAGADEMLETGAGTLAWIALIAASVFAIFTVWRQATSYG